MWKNRGEIEKGKGEEILFIGRTFMRQIYGTLGVCQYLVYYLANSTTITI